MNRTAVYVTVCNIIEVYKVGACCLRSFNLKVEAAGFCENSVTSCRTTWCRTSQENSLHINCSKNVRFHGFPDSSTD